MTIEGLLNTPGYAPFIVALAIVAAIGVLEIISLLLGATLSGLLDGALPDFDADLDMDGMPDSPLALIGFGAMPALAVLVVLLTTFGGAGLAFQNLTGLRFSPWIASVAALAFSLPATRVLSRYGGRTLFKEESQSLSHDDLIGLSATITLGETRVGHPTQAKTTDRFGTTHYVLVEPIAPDAVYGSGETVALLQREGHRYLVAGAGADALAEVSHLIGTSPKT